jgi:hypothetical protein
MELILNNNNNNKEKEKERKGMHLPHVSLIFRKLSPKTFGPHFVQSNCKNIMRG